MSAREAGLWMAAAWATVVVVLVTVLLWRVHWLLGLPLAATAAALTGLELSLDGYRVQGAYFAVACGWIVTLVLMVAVFS